MHVEPTSISPAHLQIGTDGMRRANDHAEMIEAVHARRASMLPVSASLGL